MRFRGLRPWPQYLGEFMKWHKKMCDHLDDPFIQELLYEFKADGYLVYFGTISLICKENKYDNVTGKATFRGRFLKEKFHVSVTKLQQIYDFCQTKGKLSFNFHEKNFDFDFPKILEIKDSHSKGFQVTSKSLPPKKKKEEVEVEADKHTSKSNPVSVEKSGDKKNKKKKYNFTEWDMQFANKIYDWTKEEFYFAKPPNFEEWANSVRMTREIDKRSEDDLHFALRWAFENDFWKANIRSPMALRKHFETMSAQIVAREGNCHR